jgi:hypothetical protein
MKLLNHRNRYKVKKAFLVNSRTSSAKTIAV